MKQVEKDILLMAYQTTNVCRMFFLLLTSTEIFPKNTVSSHNKWQGFVFDVNFEIPLYKNQ